MKILVLGHARHGKDTLAGIIRDITSAEFESSSMAAARIFLFDKLKDKYGYTTFEECYEDRGNHRKEWYDEICEYNRYDKARLAKDILEESDMYVGMRDDEEIEECDRQELFDVIIGVFDPMKPLESRESFKIDMWKWCDFVIPNAGTLDDLYQKVSKIIKNQ